MLVEHPMERYRPPIALTTMSAGWTLLADALLSVARCRRDLLPQNGCAAHVMTWRLVTAVAVATLPAGCSRPPTQQQLLSTSELTELVTDRTLRIPSCCNTPDGMLLYLASDGTGWLDTRLLPGYPPTPNEISNVFNWRVADGSQICFWATPRIGEMMSFVPPFSECLQIYRSRTSPDRLQAAVTRGSDFPPGWVGEVELLPFNAFPQSVIAQYGMQVRVLYGGRIPAWTAPWPMWAYARPQS
jgi:hypothetical protein